MLKNLVNNRNFKRFRSIIITLFAVFAINTAISYAGGDYSNRSTSAILPPRDMPKPKSTSAILPPRDMPKPKSTSAILPPRDMPKP